jgi:predicted GTPase
MPREVDLKEELLKIVSQLESCRATNELAKPFQLIFEECQRNRLRIGVLGITSSGKSTFLNALIARDLLPEQSKATTNLLVYCRRGPLRLEVYYENGKPTQVFNSGQFRPTLVKSFCAEDQNPKNEKGVAGIVLSTPEMRLDDRFELVDTPGLDAFGMDHHEELTLRKFLPEADIIIYMTSIRNPLKKPDLGVLEKIVQHDQRVIFVQSMMDRAGEDTEMGVVLQSRQQILHKHMERLRSDVRKHAPRLKAWHHAQVSSTWAKSSVDYERSGFPALVQSVASYGQDLQALIGERLARRTHDMLEDLVRTINQKIYEIEGESEKAKRAAKARANRKSELDKCKTTIENTNRAVGDKWRSSLAPNNLADQVSSSVFVHLPDETFEERWTDEKIRLEALSRPFLQSLDKTETDCRDALESVGIQITRESSSDMALSQSRPNLSWTWTTETVYERRWYTLWLWRHEKKVNVRKLDKRASLQQLIDYAKDLGARLINHLNWWQEKHIQTRYLAPVKEAIKNLSQADNVLAGWSEGDLTELIRVRKELVKSKERLVEHISKKPHPCEGQHPAVDKEEKISVNRSRHFLDKLVRGYRELSFHRSIFRIMAKCGDCKRHPILLAVSSEEEDLRRLVGLMRHDLGNRHKIKVSPPGAVFHSPSHDPKPFMRAVPTLATYEESRKIWDRLTLVTVLLKGTEASGQTLDRLLPEITAVCLFVNLSQVSHGVKELHDLGLGKAFSEFAKKTFFMDLHAQFFDSHRLHEIVTQALPDLWKWGPLGRRPVLMAENYDCRYTDLARFGMELVPVAKTANDADSRAAARRSVQLWQDERLSFSPPFTRQVLNDVFYRVVSESR